MASFKERINGDGSFSIKVYWTLPRSMVAPGRTKGTGSLTVYSRQDCMTAMKIAEGYRHAVTGDQVAEELELSRRVERDTSNVMTLGRWFAIWIDSLHPGPQISQRQIDTYAAQIKVILAARPRTNEANDNAVEALGSRALADLEQLHFKVFYNSLAQQGRKPETIKRYHAAMRACLNAAAENPKVSGLQRNPLSRMKIVVKSDDDEDREPEKYFEPHQYNLIIESIHEDSRLFVKFLCETGVRFSEATALIAGDFIWDQNIVNIDRAHKRAYSGRLIKTPGAPKGKSDRWVEVPPSLMSEIHYHVTRRGLGRKDLVFRAPRNGRLHHSNFLKRRWGPMMLRLSWCPVHPPRNEQSASQCTCLGDIRWTTFRPHALRHTWATWQYLMGTPIEHISHQLGHPDTAFTEKQYIHLRKFRPLGTGARLDTFLGRP